MSGGSVCSVYIRCDMKNGEKQNDSNGHLPLSRLGKIRARYRLIRLLTIRPTLLFSAFELMCEAQISPTLPTAGDASATPGLVVKNNETIRAFLLLASADEQRLPEQLRDLASDLSSRGSVPYRSLRSVWSSLPASTRPTITCIFSGAAFVFASPKPRVKSEDLKERLRKLTEMAERKEYEELVKDVAPRKEEAEPFSSYKDQVGFGLHVVVVMFTGYLIGFASFRALFNHSAVMNAAGGILGMVCGMLLETVLFIVRASGQDMLSSSSGSKQKKQQ